MKSGVGLFPSEPLGRMQELAVLAEVLGYDAVWVGDSQNIWREASLTLGVAASATSRVMLGSGVTNALTRHLGVVASTWLTLHEYVPGRVVLGIGTGDSALRTIGRKPMRLAELERTVADLRRLFAGEDVPEPASGVPFRIAHGVPATIPIYIAASAPRILQLAGKIADGVIMLVGTDPRFIEAGLDRVAAGAAAAGRSLSDLEVVLWTPTAISADAAQARSLVKAHVARVLIRPLPADLDPELMAHVEHIRSAYDYYAHMDVRADHASLVPDSLIEHFALAGDPDDCARQLDAIAQTAVDQVAIIPFAPTPSGRDGVMESFAGLRSRSF